MGIIIMRMVLYLSTLRNEGEADLESTETSHRNHRIMLNLWTDTLTCLNIIQHEHAFMTSNQHACVGLLADTTDKSKASTTDSDLSLTIMLKMLHLYSTILLFSLSASISALPATNAADYFTGLEAALNNAGLTSLLNIIHVANTTFTGSALIRSLYSDGYYTIYAPVNAVRLTYLGFSLC
jgi:hypothetical protein